MSVPAPTSNPTTTTPVLPQLCQSTGCSSYPSPRRARGRRAVRVRGENIRRADAGARMTRLLPACRSRVEEVSDTGRVGLAASLSTRKAGTGTGVRLANSCGPAPQGPWIRVLPGMMCQGLATQPRGDVPGPRRPPRPRRTPRRARPRTGSARTPARLPRGVHQQVVQHLLDARSGPDRAARGRFCSMIHENNT